MPEIISRELRAAAAGMQETSAEGSVLALVGQWLDSVADRWEMGGAREPDATEIRHAVAVATRWSGYSGAADAVGGPGGGGGVGGVGGDGGDGADAEDKDCA